MEGGFLNLLVLSRSSGLYCVCSCVSRARPVPMSPEPGLPRWRVSPGTNRLPHAAGKEVHAVTAQLMLERPPRMKPGARITWQAGGSQRSGTVWSAGHAGRSLWAIPDGPYGSRKPVLVVWLHRGHAGFHEEALAGPGSFFRRPPRARVKNFSGTVGCLASDEHAVTLRS